MRHLPLLILAVLLLHPVVPARGGLGDDEIPEENSSTVSEDSRLVREAFEAAEEAIGNEDWNTAVRRLQALVEATRTPGEPTHATPWVLPVRGRTVYEGAWIVAQHRIARGGDDALKAYAAEYGAAARELLQGAGLGRDPGALARVAGRYLPLPEARTALLALADFHLEQGDSDSALGWLDRLADLEAVSTESPEAWAPWRAARQARAASALARPGRMEEVLLHIQQSEATDAPAGASLHPVPAQLRRAAPRGRGWPTVGGAAARNAVPTDIGSKLELAWFNALEAGSGVDARSPTRPRDRPSVWHPPGCVTDGRTTFTFDGQKIYAFDVKSGRRRAVPFSVRDTSEWDARGLELYRRGQHGKREELGLLESHALTLGPSTDGGRLLYVSAPEPAGDAESWSFDAPRGDRLLAVIYDGLAFTPAFEVGGRSETEEREIADTRIYGSPLLYQGRLWVSAIRPTPGAADQAQAWLLALDPLTGEAEIETYLGLGPPVRRGRVDEAIPSSPAASRGRIVVATALGIVAAVDAHDGRPQWLLRYERGVAAQGRSRRLGSLRDTTPRLSGFRNQPPLLALDRAFVAPTDSPHLLCLFDRPRGEARELVSWRLHRRLDFRDFAAEQIVAAQGGDGTRPPRLILAGKGRSTEGDVPAPIAVALDALRPPRVLWTATATTGDGGEPYGTAIATDKELFVPTRHGISIYDVRDGQDLATLDVGGLPEDWVALLPTDVGPFGNLIPVPGKGLLAVNDSLIAFWRRKAKSD